jgi:hypothetical protein
MTRQEMFNKAYIGVILQGGPAIQYTGGPCAYLAADTGRKCGVGHLLTDVELAEVGSFQGSVYDLQDEWDGISGEPLPVWLHNDDMDFLSDLQLAHDGPRDLDGADYITHFLREMDKVAKHYGLTVPQGWEIVQAKYRECELEI